MPDAAVLYTLELTRLLHLGASVEECAELIGDLAELVSPGEVWS